MSTNYFRILTNQNAKGRVARLMEAGAGKLSNALGRDLTDVELVNLGRKAAIAAWSETLKNKVAEDEADDDELFGVAVELPKVKIANRFSIPADNWYHIAPTGEHPHPKGLIQVIDDKAIGSMVNTFREQAQADPNFPGLLVDFDHSSQGGPSSAAGWVQNLDAREDGLWANIKWSDKGKHAVESGEYRLVSPVWNRSDCVPVEKDSNRCRPMVLDSVGLTNNPNLQGLVPLSR